MLFFRSLFVLVIAVLAAADATAQAANDDLLARGKGFTVTAGDLSARWLEFFRAREKTIADERSSILSEYLADQLLEAEAKARGITVEALEAETLKGITPPTDAQILKVYEANANVFGNQPVAAVREPIVNFLRQQAEQSTMKSLIESLQTKYALKIVGDVNGPAVKPSDAVATFTGRTITLKDFETARRHRLEDSAAHIYDNIRMAIEDAALSAATAAEAAARNVDASAVLAVEITNKMRDYSDEERAELEDAFRRKMFAKYAVEILFREPAPTRENVSANGAPAIGPATAPVTIVMFSDFQCPACASTHPVLKRVRAEYGDKVRLVVRNYPLERFHAEAFDAARAAAAADRQGKFFEYTEILYKNQKALDAASLAKYAADLGLDMKRFEADMADPAVAAAIRKDIADGRSHGVLGTPTIFVNGIKVHQLSASAFRDAIEKALK